MAKGIKVVWRKLGREDAWGQAHFDPARPLIEVDPRLGSKRQLEVLCHEVLHITLFPNDGSAATEKLVDGAAKKLCNTLWQQNYRRVMLERNAKPPRIT
jgi:hypothetical protein